MNRALPFLAVLALACCSCGDGDTPNDDAIAGDVITDTGADAGDDVQIPDQVRHGDVTAEQFGNAVVLSNGLVEVRYHLDTGLFDITATDGVVRIYGAEARITIDRAGTTEIHGTMGRPATWAAAGIDDRLGDGVEMTLTIPADGDEPEMILTLGLRGGGTFVLSRVRSGFGGDAANDNAKVKYLSPLVADERTGGAMFLGADPAMHTILNNGSDVYFDYQSRIFRLGYGDSFLFQPGTVSNWSMAIKDPDSTASLVAGFMANDTAIGMVRVNYSAAASREIDGIRGFSTFEGFDYYDPPRPPVPEDDAIVGDTTDGDTTADGATDADTTGTIGVTGVTGETFYVDVAPATGQQGLEDWAARVAAFNNKTVWQDVPTGWNSWGGGGASNGYSQDIYTDRIMENFDAMVADFAPWGMKYFLIDDGWQKDHGDWVTNKTKFPDQDGQDFMPWLAAQARDQGLIPGLWIAPFWVKKSSDLYAAHPDWFADINDYGSLIIRPADNAVLDLTNPEVLQFLHDLFTRITQEWGYKWLKLDFAYYALFTKNLHDPTITAAQAYRNAMKVIRDAAGPDTFMMGVSAIGLNLGLLDGCRMTLDNMPEWGDDQQQSIKVTLMTAAHRWYLGKVWVNHPDLLFFRSEPLGLTFQEARAWASFVAIYGGVVKLAEPYVDMHDHQEWLDVVRPMIPVYPRTARPIDLFELAYPEYWVLPVERGSRTWNVVGLFNWGVNEDVVASSAMAETTRTKTMRWADLGLEDDTRALLFNVWDRTCEWATGPEWSMTAEPRTGTLLVVRPDSESPGVVFTTRHVLGGAVEVANERVTDGGAALEFDLSNPAGHEVTVYFSSRETPLSVPSPADATLAAGPCPDVWAVTFTPVADTTPVTISFVQAQ